MFDTICAAELLKLIIRETTNLSETMMWGSPVKENVCRSLVSVTLVVANDDTMWASTIINSVRPLNGPA